MTEFKFGGEDSSFDNVVNMAYELSKLGKKDEAEKFLTEYLEGANALSISKALNEAVEKTALTIVIKIAAQALLLNGQRDKAVEIKAFIDAFSTISINAYSDVENAKKMINKITGFRSSGYL